MERVLEILSGFRQYLLLIFFSLVSLALFSRSESAALRGVRSLGVEIFGNLGGGIGLVSRYFGLVSENAALLENNILLSSEVNLLRNARVENDRLRRLMDYRLGSPYKLKLARVVDRTFGSDRNLFMINLGSSDSLKVDMPVVTDRGLVGRVVLVSPSYAVVQPLINRDNKVSVVNQRSRTYGILNWQGGDESRCSVFNVPLTGSIQAGDLLVTTDFSTFAHPNTAVAVVESVEEVAGQSFFKVQAKLAVEFSSLEQVYVEFSAPEPEKETLRARYKELQ